MNYRQKHGARLEYGMDINAFSSITGLPLNMIRYYIRLGLLNPQKKGASFLFDDQCIAIAAQITQLRNCGFTIPSIASLLQHADEAAANPALYREKALSIAQNTLSHLKDERDDIQKALSAIKKLDTTVTPISSFRYSRYVSAIPLYLFQLIQCPYCHAPLSWEHLCCTNNAVTAGRGKCRCGFSSMIKNGILITSDRKNIKIPVVDKHYETLERLDKDHLRNITNRQRWLLDIFKNLELKDKVVLECAVNITSLLNSSIEEMPASAYYIVCDTDANLVEMLMKSITSRFPAQRFLFIVDDGIHHPIKQKCVDIIFDYYSSEIYQRYGYTSLISAVSQYADNGAMLLGAFSFIKTTRSTRSIEGSARYNLSLYQSALSACSVEIKKAAINNFNIPGNIFDDPEYAKFIFNSYLFWGQIKRQ